MPSIQDLSIIDSNTASAKKVEHGLERTLCSPELCDSKNLTVYKRTIAKGKNLDVKAGKDYHLLYVMNTPAKASVSFNGQNHGPRRARVCCSCRASPRNSMRLAAISTCCTWSCRSRPRRSRTVYPGGPATSSIAKRCAA